MMSAKECRLRLTDMEASRDGQVRAGTASTRRATVDQNRESSAAAGISTQRSLRANAPAALSGSLAW